MLGARPEPLNLSLPPQLALAFAHKRPSRASGFGLERVAEAMGRKRTSGFGRAKWRSGRSLLHGAALTLEPSRPFIGAG